MSFRFLYNWKFWNTALISIFWNGGLWSFAQWANQISLFILVVFFNKIFSDLVSWFNCCLHNAVLQNMLLVLSYISSVKLKIISSYCYTFLWNLNSPIFHCKVQWFSFRFNSHNFFVNVFDPSWLALIEFCNNKRNVELPLLWSSEAAIMIMVTYFIANIRIKNNFIFEFFVCFYVLSMKI